jgi:hypothetical protein
MRAVKALITAARNVRISKFRLCSVCGERNPSEWIHDAEGVCQGCAERELWVVH